MSAGNMTRASGRFTRLTLLTVLYAMQGMPMGLALGSVPLMLKSRGASFTDLVRNYTT